ncbi:hypothetical protein HQ865_19780 [Mucilaginibacter mali]|uniref:Peptidylamidoglycolate lyase n=1 Tax=Mucilaginibacter mali TaxID=2740462 RepID=A0A7D4QVU0_9SPHI|nr:peptidyl-alpha-hydroxyglycine alpha-amidating lyase family protein [Mucilaginibacter mali]QKJ31909.1 hypothetical protein HQ865_19780 [Mucilaginibacter mali]
MKNWPALPDTLHLGNPAGIGVDTSQNIFVFRRGSRVWPLIGAKPTTPIAQKTVLLLDNKTGKLISSWGDHLFVMPHGLTVDSADNVWLTDVGLHQVFKFTHDGKLLMRLGVAGIPGNDARHFDQPTDVAVAPDGSFYVSDGYGNSRVVKFSSAGKYLLQWGTKGSSNGQFNIPHGITLDGAGNVYVADRENNRIEVFGPNGKFLKQIANKGFGRICGITYSRVARQLIFVDDPTSWLSLKHHGSSVILCDTVARVFASIGPDGRQPVTWYHDVAIDRKGNIFTADILNNKVGKFRWAGTR